MRSINVTDGVHERVALLARAWGVSEGEAIRRLLDEFVRSNQRVTAPEPDTEIPVHAVYEGNRIDAIYHPKTKRVDVVTGVLAGQSYKSPSGAAIAVVRAHKPNVHPNRNGWTFWTITKSGDLLQTIRS